MGKHENMKSIYKKESISLDLHEKSIVLLVIIRIVNTLHKHFPIINLRCQRRPNLSTFISTYSHGRQIPVFIYPAPIHTSLERTFQHKVKPNTGTTTVGLDVIKPNLY